MKKLLSTIAALIALAWIVPANAVPVTYNIEGTIGGSINGSSFGPTNYDITLIGDPNSSAGSFSSGVFTLDLTSGSASAVAETLPLSSPVFTLNGSSGLLSLFQNNTLLLTFNLSAQSVSEITGSPTSFTADGTDATFFNLSSLAPGLNIVTDTGAGVVFTAAVPEPSTWAMMILGFCGVGFMAYRRKPSGPALRLA
jgi:hypothetical protein